MRAGGAPPPWANLAERPPAPTPFAAELGGPPGAAPAPGDAAAVRALPFWASADGEPPQSFEGRDVPVIEGGQGGQLQHRPEDTRSAKVGGKNAPGPAGRPTRAGAPGPTPPRERPMSYADVIADQAGQEQASIGRSGELEAQAAQARADGLAKQAEFERANIRDRQLAEMERRKDLAQREAALEAERQAIANTPINDRAWWDGLDGNKKDMAILGAMIGGMLSVTSGSGKNDFVEWMDGRIAQNIEVQKANLANRQEALGHGESMYSKILQRYGDERIADEMFAASYYTALGHEALAQAAQFDSPKAKENATMLGIQAAQRANASIQAAAAAQQDLAIRKQQVGIQAFEARTGRQNADTARQNADWSKEKDIADLALQYEQLGYTKEAALAKARTDAMAKAEVDAETALLGPDGSPIVDPKTGRVLKAGGNVEIAGKARTRMAARFNFRRQVTEYENFMKEMGREFGGMGPLAQNEALTRANQIWSNGLFSTKESEGTGALDKGMVEIYELHVPKPDTWLKSSHAAAGANQARKEIDNKINNSMRMEYGYTGGNYTDNFDAQVQGDQSQPGSKWLNEHNEHEQQRDQEAVEGAKYVPPVTEVGKPPMGMADTRVQRREELQRERPAPRAAPAPAPVPGPRTEELSREKPKSAEVREVEDRIDYVERVVAEREVVLRTSNGDVKVPRGSLTRSSATPLADGSFASTGAPPAKLPAKPKAWADVENDEYAKAEKDWAKSKNMVGRK
jgi:hypothetical protein